jgi:hypothetical protein
MRQFMMTVTAMAAFGAMAVTAQAENNPSRTARVAESASTCTGLKPLCLTNCGQTPVSQLYCQRICNFRWERCMESGWFAGRWISRAAERR